jgi:uncharacterized protein
MRRRDKEITDPATIEEILASSQICRIAMAEGDEPYLVPVNYGYAAGVLYVHSAAEGRKIDILRRTHRVCFEIDSFSAVVKDAVPCEWSVKYRSVIGYASAEFITDDAGKRAALDCIMAQYGKKDANEYNDNQVRSIVVVKLTIQSITGKQSGDWDDK